MLSLIAFDTDHIKKYVFGTSKLKEIRGASSLLDYLNRIVMELEGLEHKAKLVYANGGSGLFWLEGGEKEAERFGKSLQGKYHEKSSGSLSVTYAYQVLPETITKNNVMTEDIKEWLELLQWKLQEEKLKPPTIISLSSHPFMKQCDACGIEYANAGLEGDKRAPGEREDLYCESCKKKRDQDTHVKVQLKRYIKRVGQVGSIQDKNRREHLWNKVISLLKEKGYKLSGDVVRPQDFNVFSQFAGAKNYFGLIYADANNMGQANQENTTLKARSDFAEKVDGAIYKAACAAIHQHLQIDRFSRPEERSSGEDKEKILPFDILLLGGDDVMMLVPATVALEVALTVAEEFRRLSGGYTLSVGVVLAPVRYPFALLHDMVESTLKFAKKASADVRAQAKLKGEQQYDDTRINFMVVAGSSHKDFSTIFERDLSGMDKERNGDKQQFYATLRPYTTEDLSILLNAVKAGNQQNLGRTKLHQLREAVLHKNLTTGVVEALALLSNWREKQRDFVVNTVYEFGIKNHKRTKLQYPDTYDPIGGFPQVVFPWYLESKTGSEKTYRTALLDFVELYDFVSREAGTESNEN